MTRTTRLIVLNVSVCALVILTTSLTQAGTIIKLNLGGVGPDVGMNGSGVLSTVDETVGPPPTGDQFTAIEYTGFLDPIPDITTNTATFSMNGLDTMGQPATVVGTLVIQNFFGGIFSLYDPGDNLLLQGPMTNSALTGVMGPPGTGALFTTTLGNVTAGSLMQFIAPGSVALSMSLAVNGGTGFVVVPPVTGGVLQSFLADASLIIRADPMGPGPGVPEPASLMLVLMGVAAAACGWRRAR